MRVGEVRVRLLRVMQYASFVTFGASVATAFKVFALSGWWVLLGIVPLFVLYWLDGKVVKGEQAYFNNNNEALQTLINEVKKINERQTKNSIG
jgi:hypothetical protein